MQERPIRCGREGCGWRGYEAGLEEEICDGGRGISLLVCPTCGYGSTSNMTPGEIQAWERAQAQQKGPKQ